jgi:plasmid stabilization system protein ParE
MSKIFRLRYLPLFQQDVAETMDHIAIQLKNPIAAHQFMEEVETAIEERLSFPLAYEPYPSSRKRAQKYYRIYVKNYTIFYVVIDDIMEVRRLLYSRRNLSELI